MSTASPNDLPNAVADLSGPGAGGAEANSVDARSLATAGDDQLQSTGPARPDLRQPCISFTCAYWDYLRRLTPEEPVAAEYGLSENLAEPLRRQCTIDFNGSVVARAQAAARQQKPSTKGAP